MEEGREADKEEKSEVFAVDTRKTYEGIISRKEAELAKEAQFERRALLLTKHFIKSYEESQSHKLDHLAESSQRHYERSMARVKKGFESESMHKEMVREEKNQISQLMAERQRQRELEEQKKREAKAERDYYMQARIIHNKLQAEERKSRIEEQQKERAEAIKKKLRSHDEKLKEMMQEKSTGVTSTTAKFEERLEKVSERRKQNDIEGRKERHEKMSARAEKEKRALDERRQRVERKQQDIREAEEERYRKIQERKMIEEQEKIDKVQRIMEKCQAAERYKTEQAKRPEPQPHVSLDELLARGSPAGDETGKGAPDSPNQGDAEARKKHHGGMGSVLPNFYSGELIEQNNQAARDYVLRKKEMDDARYKMGNTKRYKQLAEAAVTLPDDDRSRRLKMIHQSHVAKEKDQKKDDPISVRGSQRPTPRITPRTQKCGFCEKEFPPDHLVGSALRRTIQKLKHETPSATGKNTVTKQKAANAGYGSSYASEAVCASGHASEAYDSRPPKKSGLYDYDVKLCMNCDIFVRITTS